MLGAILLSKSPGLAPGSEIFILLLFVIATWKFIFQFFITFLLLTVITLVFKLVYKTNFSWLWVIVSGLIGFFSGSLIQLYFFGISPFLEQNSFLQFSVISSVAIVFFYLLLQKRKKKKRV